jgi:hypothetical protein
MFMLCFQTQKWKSCNESRISSKNTDTSNPTVGLYDLSFYQNIYTISALGFSSVGLTDQSSTNISPSSDVPLSREFFWSKEN